eukprot:c9324_g1_i1.p1 GENE.c9324_g1_i1~~c9324_g1_i1.p1  ORF type:complete len:298 (+),score=71.26 c9324_g1_i1:52-894(+)
MFFPVWRLVTGHNFTSQDVIEGCGWIYFVAWSISFYPQIILNHQRRSVVGLSLDFVVLNVSGFAFYLTYVVANMLGGDTNIHTQDVLFAAHAFLCCAVIAIQCVVLDRGTQVVSFWVKIATVLVWLGALLNLLLLFRHAETSHAFTQQLGLFKVVISFIKYMPQAYLNYRRKSTTGWSITNILLDFTGGIFSTIKIFVDLGVKGQWDPDVLPMLLLGLESLGFDLIFMLQHYVWYRAPKKNHRHRGRLGQMESSTKTPYSHEVSIPSTRSHTKKHAFTAD